MPSGLKHYPTYTTTTSAITVFEPKIRKRQTKKERKADRKEEQLQNSKWVNFHQHFTMWFQPMQVFTNKWNDTWRYKVDTKGEYIIFDLER